MRQVLATGVFRAFSDLSGRLRGCLAGSTNPEFGQSGYSHSNPFQKLQLQIIGAVAEFERAIIKERQLEGIRAAQKAGKQMGRAKALIQAQIDEIRARTASGETKKALAQEYGISRQTLYAALAR